VSHRYQADLWPHRDFIAKRIASKMTDRQIARALVADSRRHRHPIEVWKAGYRRRDLECDIAAQRKEINAGVQRMRRPRQRRRRCPGELFSIDGFRNSNGTKYMQEVAEGTHRDFANIVDAYPRGNRKPLDQFLRERSLTDRQCGAVVELARSGCLLDATEKVVALARRLVPWAKRRNQGKVRWGGMRDILADAYKRLVNDGEDLKAYDASRALVILKRSTPKGSPRKRVRDQGSPEATL
jgi:hypothetical protein